MSHSNMTRNTVADLRIMEVPQIKDTRGNLACGGGRDYSF